MKVNVDAYYLARICMLDNIKITGVKKDLTLMYDYTADLQKITIVSYNGEYHQKYSDLLSDETYDIGVRLTDEPGKLFIDKKLKLIPVNCLIKGNKKYMTKAELINELREFVIDANKKILDGKTKGKIKKYLK